jgi:hypothetical protein
MQYINEAKRWQKLAGLKEDNQNEIFGIGNNKYSLRITLDSDNKNIKKGEYKVDLPKKMWPGAFNNDDEKLLPYLEKYPSNSKVELVKNGEDVEETGILMWDQNKKNSVTLIEKLGYYLTPTSDPKTAKLNITTDEKPALSKSYEPLSPKSQRKDALTPKSIEKALINALRNNKMDYEKSIAVVSDKLNINKDKLKKDFPKSDMIYKSSLDEIDQVVNEALKHFRTDKSLK